MLIFFQELSLQLFLWLLALIDGLMEIFSGVAGVTNVRVNGQSVNIIEYLAGNSTVGIIFWCIFILAVGLTCIFTIVGLIKNMIANNRNISSIVGKFFLALLGTMAMLAVVFLGNMIANALLQLLARIFRISNTAKLSNALFNACVGDWLNGYDINKINVSDLSVRDIFGGYNSAMFGIWPTGWKCNGMVNPNTFMYLPALIAGIALGIALIVAVLNLAKSGVFGRVIKIGQKNFGIEDVVQQNIDINYFANALKQLEQNQSADIVKIDRPVNLDGFASDLFERLSAVKDGDEESGVKEIKENILRERIDRIDRLNNIRKQYISDYYVILYGRNELDLESTAVNVAGEISKCGLNTQILNMRDTAVFLKYSFSRNFDEREIKDLKDGELLDWVKPKEIVFHANKYKIDGTEAAVLAVSDYPLRVKNAWGAELFNIPNTKVVMRVKPVDKFKAIRRIDKCIGEMETKQIISEKASDISSAEVHRETMDALLDALQTENESLFDVTLTVTAYDYNGSGNYKRETRKKMLTGNFRPSTLYGLQIEGFKSSAVSPLTTLKSHERGINSSSLAAAFPFVRTFVMDDGGILLGENNKSGFPFIFNIWKRGNLYQNSNAFVIGKSGSGKSYFLKNLVLNEWANGTRVIMLDPEAEYLALTRNLYGNVINVGNAREGRINPFHIYKILTEDGTPADSKVTFNTHLKMLESFFKIVLADAPVDVIELINNLIVETYERMGITENTDCSEFPADYFPLFSDLLETLQSKDISKADELTKRDMRTAELYLQKFVNGRYSDIWNAPSTLKVNADLIDFDFQSLFANKNNVVANAQMLLVFRFIEQEVINAREKNKNGANLRTLIIADEAHLYIDPKFPIALDFFYSMSKRIRKYNGSFIPATQNIADWNASEELRGKTSAIIKNSQYTFIFKLSAPDMKDVLDVYRAGDSFNDEEQRMIILAVTGQAFFVGSTELRACVRIQAGKVARELFNEEKEIGENKK